MSEQKSIGAIICCAATCMSVFMLPFIVCDLYYGYNQTMCANTVIANSSISITISTWLKVDGFCMLALVILLYTIGLFTCMSASCLGLAICYALISAIYAVFRLAWLIVGAVMFWGYLQPNNLCSGPLTGYMWALLILGFLGVCGSCFNSRQVSNKKE